jgi:hypothetical protein
MIRCTTARVLSSLCPASCPRVGTNLIPHPNRPSAWLTGDFHVDKQDILPAVFPGMDVTPHSIPASHPGLRLSVTDGHNALPQGYPQSGNRHVKTLQKGPKGPLTESDGPGEASIGVRVAVYWEQERRSFAGTVRCPRVAQPVSSAGSPRHVGASGGGRASVIYALSRGAPPTGR